MSVDLLAELQKQASQRGGAPTGSKQTASNDPLIVRSRAVALVFAHEQLCNDQVKVVLPAARRFVDGLGPRDNVAVITFPNGEIFAVGWFCHHLVICGHGDGHSDGIIRRSQARES